MNLTVADVIMLAWAVTTLLVGNGSRLLDGYAEQELHRIWKAQHFSWWMANMLHNATHADDFNRRRQLGGLRSFMESEAGRTYLPEAYTGWPVVRSDIMAGPAMAAADRPEAVFDFLPASECTIRLA